MRLALKLISVTVLGISLVLAIDTFASVRRDIALFNADARHDSQVLGSAVSTMLRDVVRGGGQARAQELLREVNAAQPSIELRWVWLGEPGEDSSQPQVSPQELEPVLKGENKLLTAEDHSGQECLFNYLPIVREGQRLGVLEISEPLTRLEAQHRAFIIREALVMAGLIAFSGLAAVVLGAVWVGWPLSRLIEKVRCVGRGDLASPLQVRGRHEFGELALAINTMCGQLAESHEKVQREHAARVRTLQQLRHADRLTTVGSLASGIAHELGTPLNVISARAKLIAEGEVPQDEIPENARTIRTQAQRMTTIIRQLLDFARRRPLTKTQVDFREVADHVVDLLSPLARKRGVTLSLDGGAERLSTRIDLGQMEQVVTNLVVNAIQASPRAARWWSRWGTSARGPAPIPRPPRQTTCGFRSRITAWASPPRTSRGYSSPSSRPKTSARGRAWGCPSRTASPRSTAAGSSLKANPNEEADSHSACRWSKALSPTIHQAVPKAMITMREEVYGDKSW